MSLMYMYMIHQYSLKHACIFVFSFTLFRYSSYFWVLCGLLYLSLISLFANTYMYMYYILSPIYFRKSAPHPRSLSPDPNHQLEYLLATWHLVSHLILFYVGHGLSPVFHSFSRGQSTAIFHSFYSKTFPKVKQLVILFITDGPRVQFI